MLQKVSDESVFPCPVNSLYSQDHVSPFPSRLSLWLRGQPLRLHPVADAPGERHISVPPAHRSMVQLASSFGRASSSQWQTSQELPLGTPPASHPRKHFLRTSTHARPAPQGSRQGTAQRAGCACDRDASSAPRCRPQDPAQYRHFPECRRLAQQWIRTRPP